MSTVDTSVALTTLANLKEILNIGVSTYDSPLSLVINQVSARVNKITGRQFVATEHCEFQRPCGDIIDVNNFPVIYVARVAYGTFDALDATYAGSDIRATAEVYADGVRLLSVAAAGTATESTLTFATYPTLSTMATAISAVADWTGANNVSTDGKSCNLYPTAGMDATGTATMTWPDQSDTDYDVEHSSGRIRIRENNDFNVGSGGSRSLTGQYMIEYKAGYATLPADIDMACTEWCQEVWGRMQVNAALASEGHGTGSASLVNAVMTRDGVLARLAEYTDIGMGNL